MKMWQTGWIQIVTGRGSLEGFFTFSVITILHFVTLPKIWLWWSKCGIQRKSGVSAIYFKKVKKICNKILFKIAVGVHMIRHVFYRNNVLMLLQRSPNAWNSAPADKRRSLDVGSLWTFFPSSKHLMST